MVCTKPHRLKSGCFETIKKIASVKMPMSRNHNGLACIPSNERLS
ncbi:MAG: hypothetical protein ACI9G1_003582 [Pirellulaceae bacterium]|jgi:hypothetical protein